MLHFGRIKGHAFGAYFATFWAHLRISFWAVSCVTVYACVLPWNNIAQDFLLEKYLCPGTCEPEPCCSTATHQVPAAGQPGQFNPTKDDAINTVKYAMSIPVPNHHAPPST